MRKFPFEGIAPFLLAVYPILFLVSNNLRKVMLADTLIAIAFGLLLAGALLIVTRLLLRDVQRSRFITALALLLFFGYGHAYNLFQGLHEIPLFPFDQHPWLLLLWIALLLAGALFALRRPRRLPAVNRAIGVVSGLLIGVALATITLNLALYREPPLPPPAFAVQPPPVLPDIYYIILDEYTGNSTLLNKLGYDNTPFTDSLRERGFFVATDARANYFMTYLSLASSLNMDYLDTLPQQPDPEAASIQMVKNNVTVQALKNLGYDYIHFATGFAVSNTSPWADVVYDGYASQQVNIAGVIEFDTNLLRLNDFYLTLGRTTLLLPFMENIESGDSRSRTLYNLEKLAEVPAMPEPTFTFAHFILPHIPYVFGRDDGPVNPNGRSVDGTVTDQALYSAHAAYIDQIVFTNRAVSQLVDMLLEQSPVEPIILIQGDHGFRWLCSDCYTESSSWDDNHYAEVVLPILSAYYLPGGGDAGLTPDMSPVNSFRVIFDHYFGAELGLLENRYYRAADYYHQPFDFMDITGVVQASAPTAAP